MRKYYTIVLAAALPMIGCANSDQYKQFATVGTQYSMAVDSTLAAAYEAFLQSNAELLLTVNRTQRSAAFDRSQCSPDRQAMADLDQFSQLTCLTFTRGEIFADLRQHTALLARYFSEMARLATTDVSERAASATEATADQLVNVGADLRTLVPAEVGELTGMAVDAAIRGALRDELQARANTIRQELATEEELLQFLAVDVAKDLDRSFNDRFLRQVVEPFIDGVPSKDADKWVSSYTSLLRTQTNTIPQIQEASKLAQRLRESFEELLRGGDVLTQLAQIAADADALARAARILSS